ncbi:hypothetical protein F2P45_32810 [Massilia sp. CCM 8733]|uniref:Uncharacterized protein n=1 Tax=Massilia mucilaginosa TaxID=2609282 RepID=A0ABX0P384_9BURK|nr:hypothetical protein [Massilia mucilaginosa]NHZ93745.1 hypothetical protein [Massilia mucilaginosa]
MTVGAAAGMRVPPARKPRKRHGARGQAAPCPRHLEGTSLTVQAAPPAADPRFRSLTRQSDDPVFIGCAGDGAAG